MSGGDTDRQSFAVTIYKYLLTRSDLTGNYLLRERLQNVLLDGPA